MAEALVIRFKPASQPALPSAPESTPGAAAHEGPTANAVQAEWLTVDTDGTRQGNVQSGSLGDAAAYAGARKIIALVPGTAVLLAEPVLPLKSGAKLLQVVPFALEEQMATDVENLHFAVGRRDTRPGTPVAVVALAQMDAWQSALLDAGLHADSIYAETSVLPATPNGVTLLVDGTRVYVRRETAPGAVLDVEPLIEAVQLALAAGDDAREHVTIYLTEDVYERDRDLFEGLREFTASLQLKLLADGPLPLFAANAFQKTPVNLLQGRYALKTRLKLSFQPWRYAAMLAVAFIALHLGLKTWQYIDLKKAEARLDSEIAQVFQQAMPGAPVPAALSARKQMEARLNALRGSGPVGGIIATFGTLGEAMAQAPGTSIEALSYRDNVTDLRVMAPSVDALDKIQHVASERGMATEIQSANPRDSKIEGRLKLKQPDA